MCSKRVYVEFIIFFKMATRFNHYNYSLDEIRRLGIGILPQSLKEAINALEADTLFSQQLGSEFIQEFIEVKNMEWVEYERHVSRWEIERYLEYF